MFSRVLTWIKWVFGIVPKSAMGSPVLFRVIHYTMVALIALLLGIFSDRIFTALEITRQHHEGFRWIDRYWFGIVFLLGYAIIRSVLYLISILGIEEEGEFTDIDRPWRRALEELAQEELYVDDLPLFLVNGLTPQQEQSVFLDASNVEWKVVCPPPNETTSPLRVFADSNAIFVSCTGIGAVSCQQGKIVDSRLAATSGAAPVGSGSQTQQAGEMASILSHAKRSTGTMPAGGALQAAPVAPTGTVTQAETAQPPPTTATGTLRSIGAAIAGATMSPGGVQRAMKSMTSVSPEAKGYGKKQVAPINDVEAELGFRRMGYFCSLLQDARNPYCPINGLLQVIPLSWATSPEHAKKLAPAIRYDIECIHETLQLQFPVVIAFSEMDSILGLKEFLVRLERLHKGIRNSRAGSRFWPGAEINIESLDLLLDRSMNWFRGWIYAAFADDINSAENQSLFHLLCQIRQKKPALASLLKGALSQVTEPEMRLSGCYFIATGAGATEQGFIRGVLDRLVEMEEEIAWSPDLEITVSKRRVLTQMLIAGTALFVAANAWILYKLLNRST